MPRRSRPRTSKRREQQTAARMKRLAQVLNDSEDARRRVAGQPPVPKSSLTRWRAL